MFLVRGAHGRELTLGPRLPRVMGIVNLTPDSFSDGGRFMDARAAVDAALTLEADGAAILDLGAESSRPGAEPVAAGEELARLLPVLEALRPRTGAVISVDTTKAEVAAAALARGADWINDISALRSDPELASVVAERRAGLVLMHMLGEPKTMQRAPHYDDVVAEVRAFLAERVQAAAAAGIDPERVLVDPGIGFGKRQADNVALIAGLPQFAELGRPLLLGVSRKAFLGVLIARDGAAAAERDAATVAVVGLAHAAGVSVHRVHNVRYAVDALRTLTGISRQHP